MSSNSIDEAEFVLPDPIAIAISAILQAYDHTSASLVVEAKGPTSLYKLLLIKQAPDGTLAISPDAYVSRKDRVSRPLIRVVLDAGGKLLHLGSVLIEDR